MFEALVFSVGFGFHAVDWNRPVVEAHPSPLGIVRIHNPLNSNLEVYCEHISSLPNKDVGWGINHCGILLEFK